MLPAASPKLTLNGLSMFGNTPSDKEVNSNTFAILSKTDWAAFNGLATPYAFALYSNTCSTASETV